MHTEYSAGRGGRSIGYTRGMNTRTEVAAYYFPNYRVDPRNEAAHGTGWTEWELVKRAEPRFPGHVQPKTPLWGEENEADPSVMAKKIDAAALHGLTQFIFDWYWYDDGPFLARALDDGFLKAPNADTLGFALMWANHDWADIHPAKRRGWPLQFPGAVTLETFETLTDHVIKNYFSHPSYWKIDGKPYFSIYELSTLLRGFGGGDETRAALDRFRAKTVAAGFPGLHLNAVVWGIPILPGEKSVSDPNALLNTLGFDSIGSYVWIHHVPMDTFPEAPYSEVLTAAESHWRRTRAEFTLPFHPNVTMGWDASPRTVQSDRFEATGYPFMATLSGNTPAAFQGALVRAKAFLDEETDGPRILTLNAWNEWTEGSYLEPDTVNKLGYLEAVRNVFHQD